MRGDNSKFFIAQFGHDPQHDSISFSLTAESFNRSPQAKTLRLRLGPHLQLSVIGTGKAQLDLVTWRMKLI